MSLFKKKLKEVNILESTQKTEEKKDVKQEVRKDVLKVENVKVANKKYKFKYTVINNQGQYMKGYFDAETKSEVELFLKNEGYKIEKIEISKDINFSLRGAKLNYGDLSFILAQLSTYLKASIPLIDSVRILEKQAQKPLKRKIFSSVIYELVKGESFSSALEHQGEVFPKLLINMVRTAEMTGDLPGVLDDMNNYYSSLDKTRKQMVSAMTYPLIILAFSLFVVAFILIYVVPRFVDLFNQNNAELPLITKIVVAVSLFFKTYYIYLLIGLVLLIIIIRLIFKNVKSAKVVIQKVLMKLPVVGPIIIANETTMFTKTFASLLAHNVFITDSMAVLNKISDNEVYRLMINECLDNLSKGKKISEAFKGKWAFPVVAYEMLVTGENTGQLATMMTYVGNYYQDLHANLVKRLNTFIEPVMIVFLAGSVGFIILSIIVPLFDFYGQIG